jgi:hypothetical protein
MKKHTEAEVKAAWDSARQLVSWVEDSHRDNERVAEGLMSKAQQRLYSAGMEEEKFAQLEAVILAMEALLAMLKQISQDLERILDQFRPSEEERIKAQMRENLGIK